MNQETSTVVGEKTIFDDYLLRWGLATEGEPIVTAGSKLLPVRYRDVPAMLKIASAPEEERGASLMSWWQGRGAARVFAYEGRALLLERATGEKRLAHMARQGQDDAASRIICEVAATLHESRSAEVPSTLVPLARWFEELDAASVQRGGLFVHAAATARQLLAEPREIVVLHGDLHHGNVLDAGTRGWLAIDPKGLWGERGFDFANIFCNPDAEIATAARRLARQIAVVAEAANLERARLVKWVFAYAGLSAAWSLDDGTDPTIALAIAELALAEMNHI